LAKTSPDFCRSVAAGCAKPSELCSRVIRSGLKDVCACALDALTEEEFEKLMQEEISSVCWPTWRNSGMGPPTAFLTLSSSECHSDAGVCSLSDVLETGEVPRKYFLSPTACRGILRRAEKRGRELPTQLRKALTAVAQTITE
jgi:hypothetical protein